MQLFQLLNFIFPRDWSWWRYNLMIYSPITWEGVSYFKKKFYVLSNNCWQIDQSDIYIGSWDRNWNDFWLVNFSTRVIPIRYTEVCPIFWTLKTGRISDKKSYSRPSRGIVRWNSDAAKIQNKIMVLKKCATLNWKNDFGVIMGNYVVLGSPFI